MLQEIEALGNEARQEQHIRSDSAAMVELGSDPTVIVNHAPGSAAFDAILAAEGASHSNSGGVSYSFVSSPESPAEVQLLEPVNDDDLLLVTDIA